jgi:hypothetical protein
MRTMPTTSSSREDLLAGLAAMPRFLEQRLGALAADAARIRGSDDKFSPVEQIWHLADLEREGYAVRIRRLLAEPAPALADFDGARVAEERNYRTLDLRLGLEAFRSARAENLAALRAVTAEQWTRSGSLEGVGPLALCDLPRMMSEHDAGHRAEIEAWLRWR